MTPDTVVLGGGGHARVVAAALEACSRTVAGWVGKLPVRGPALNLPRLGDDDWLQSQGCERYVLANGVGSVADTTTRARVYERYVDAGYRFPAFIHPGAIVAEDFSDVPGLQIMAGAVVQPGCRFGVNVLINTSASIDHDCKVADNAHIACGAVLSGGVEVGRGAHVGAGAIVLQEVRIGEGAVVGAGAVVIDIVESGALVVGNPGVMRKRGAGKKKM